MKVSNEALRMIKHHEGVRLRPYQDPIKLWTVGVGHLIGDGKSLPTEWNRSFTIQEIDQIIKTRFSEV
jgi:GH24 family phage-related lysozyme (muramidase)